MLNIIYRGDGKAFFLSARAKDGRLWARTLAGIGSFVILSLMSVPVGPKCVLIPATRWHAEVAVCEGRGNESCSLIGAT